MFRHYDVFGPKIRLTRPEKAGLAVAGLGAVALELLLLARG